MDAAFARVTAVGEDEGVAFRFDRLRRAPNTRLPHRVVALARREGQDGPTVEALFQGYF